MNAERIWDAALGQLQLEMPRAAFDTWVRDAELLTHEDGTFIIGVQNAYARDWLEDRLRSTVTRVLSSVTGRSSEVRFIVWHGEQEEAALSTVGAEVHEAMPMAANGNVAKTLQPRYSFESFVVGQSNRLAAAAAQAVAESQKGAVSRTIDWLGPLLPSLPKSEPNEAQKQRRDVAA